MYEVPTKGDLDRNLSILMHDARAKAKGGRLRITNEFAARDMGSSTALVQAVVGELDTIHRQAIVTAMETINDFAQRMNITATEAGLRCKQLLETLGNNLFVELPAAGFPDLQRQLRVKYEQVFRARLEGALRDLAVGFINRRNIAMKDADRRAIILSKLYEERHSKSWIRIPIEDTRTQEEQVVEANICDQLSQVGLIEWKGHIGMAAGMAKITARGIDVIEGTAKPPIAITVDARQISISGSANVQVGDGSHTMHAANTRVAQGDFEGLRSRLQKLGISDSDIEELRERIEADKAEGKPLGFKGRVGHWVAEQTSKAASGAIALGIEKVTPELIDTIKSFFPN